MPPKALPKADPRMRVDVSPEVRERLLRRFLLVKEKDQEYQDDVNDTIKELKVGEGLVGGKYNITYDPLVGRILVTKLEG
jgi:hypothetical protein